uniref:Uncharacterized protein n=1 Tax=viral metagenome TaxID=1070528 RepID=A0A6C0H4S1_9ZZZZ
MNIQRDNERTPINVQIEESYIQRSEIEQKRYQIAYKCYKLIMIYILLISIMILINKNSDNISVVSYCNLFLLGVYIGSETFYWLIMN